MRRAPGTEIFGLLVGGRAGGDVSELDAAGLLPYNCLIMSGKRIQTCAVALRLWLRVPRLWPGCRGG